MYTHTRQRRVQKFSSARLGAFTRIAIAITRDSARRSRILKRVCIHACVLHDLLRYNIVDAFQSSGSDPSQALGQSLVFAGSCAQNSAEEQIDASTVQAPSLENGKRLERVESNAANVAFRRSAELCRMKTPRRRENTRIIIERSSIRAMKDARTCTKTHYSLMQRRDRIVRAMKFRRTRYSRDASSIVRINDGSSSWNRSISRGGKISFSMIDEES